MSAVLDALAAKAQRVSVEVVPPSRGADPDGIIACIEALAPYDPAFVSVTDHPGGRLWVDESGTPKSMPARAKPGTLGLCVALRQETGLPVVPHVVCLGNDRFSAEDAFIDFRYAGFKDVFVVRGDERFAPYAKAAVEELPSALDLVRLAAALNRGEYAGGASRGSAAGFSIGVTAYPEKHPASPNPERDLAALAAKEEAGARWALSQMVFDAAVFKDFLARCRSAGIGLPIMPGIKPLCSLRSLSSVPRHFFVNLPEAFIRNMEAARSPAEERLVGIRYASELCAGLYDAGAPCLHFFSMGKPRDTVETLAALFGPGAKGAR
jgi:methylenetetrahydrofolate reductase (NADPH)